jgi:tetratricopeptide (TPR) repeat protein
LRSIVPAILIAIFATLVGPPPARAAIDAGVEHAAVARGDREYDSAQDFEAALATWRAALDADSSSYDLCWRIARATSDRGARAEFDGNKEKAEASFEQSQAAARRATALQPGRPEGHLELAVALGRLALFKGGKAKIRLSKEVEIEAKRALEIDPRLDRAHHVLGRWNRGVAELQFLERAAARVVYGGLPKGATMDAAVAHFEAAIELRPDYANHHLELGRTYLGLKLRQKARQELEKALACPPHSPFDADYRREAKRLLAGEK